MDSQPNVSFDDIATAFSYKTDRELRKANFVFSIVNHPWMSAVATGAANLAIKLHLPVKGIIKKTVFEHFCGGEDINSAYTTVARLGAYHVGTILDYSVEGEKTDAGFEQTTEETLRTLEKARESRHIPFCVFKVTGIGDAALLEKIQSGSVLNDNEQKEFEKIRQRVDRICATAHQYDVPVLIDAEESWIQDPIDTLAYEMMARYNQTKAIVFNTYQFYRSDMMRLLRDAYHNATMHNYFLGAKLVRGAYMEKEADRAERMGYANPIHSSKEATDDAFNKGLAFCIDNKQRISLVCGSHNDYSNYYLTVLMDKHSLKPSDNRVWFAQLYGMSDTISFNLAKAGYNVAKYVPYGPVRAVMPYLIRRAQENTSVAGQSSRELTLIRREIQRRKGR